MFYLFLNFAHMNYNETIQWLYKQLPMYQRIGKAAYKADLKKTIILLNTLGNPQKHFKTIHIAGTNGKGSVSHMVASAMQQAGYKTGLYTSPHLNTFRERIKINGTPIPEDFIIYFVATHLSQFQKIKPSFFEMTVAMAYNYFATEKVDIAILETGMGGRLDSTNINFPIVTAITNIAFDHTLFLGNTIKEIASEKAGIIKKNIPIIIGRKQKNTTEIFCDIAKQKHSPIIFAEDNIELKTVSNRNSNKKFYDIWVHNELYAETIHAPLNGNYQKENIPTALQILFIINKSKQFYLNKKDIIEGLEQTVNNTGLHGRWQTLNTNPLTIADIAHNADGINAIVNQLQETDFDKLHFVLGMVNDKNHNKILALLPKKAQYYFCSPNIPRALNVETLEKKAFEAGLNGLSYPSVRHAYNSAINNAGAHDLVFISGSTFVVAEVI